MKKLVTLYINELKVGIRGLDMVIFGIGMPLGILILIASIAGDKLTGNKEEDIRIEICEAVTKVGVDSNLVKFKVFPEVKEAACIFHKGSYNYLPKSYEKLLTFIENNGELNFIFPNGGIMGTFSPNAYQSSPKLIYMDGQYVEI